MLTTHGRRRSSNQGCQLATACNRFQCAAACSQSAYCSLLLGFFPLVPDAHTLRDAPGTWKAGACGALDSGTPSPSVVAATQSPVSQVRTTHAMGRANSRDDSLAPRLQSQAAVFVVVAAVVGAHANAVVLRAARLGDVRLDSRENLCEARQPRANGLNAGANAPAPDVYCQACRSPGNELAIVEVHRRTIRAHSTAAARAATNERVRAVLLLRAVHCARKV